MFVEKLRSILKFGRYSTRYRDIFDLYYLKDNMDVDDLKKCINEFVIEDPGMRENDMQMVVSRFENSTDDEDYIQGLEMTDKNWLDVDPEVAVRGLSDYLKKLL